MSDGGWGVERLDLAAYVERVGYAGRPDPTGTTLRALHRSHVGAISFENLDILLGRGIALDLPALQAKMVRRPRGGYCHEQNLLFAAVLERLGFGVTRLLARPDRSLPRGHCTLLVEAADGTWLADVGYGGQGPLEPVPLIAGPPVRQGGWWYRLDRDGDEWVLRTCAMAGSATSDAAPRSSHGADADGWLSLYAVTPHPYRQQDFEMASYFTSTHPSSPFTRGIIVQRNTDSARYALRGHELTVERPDGSRRRRAVDPDRLAGVLATVFGIGLTDDEVRTLIRPPSPSGPPPLRSAYPQPSVAG
jgi:N-hydroxyarylamine O-acetyltransferase